MLDIKFIRENKDIVASGAKKKHVDIDIERLITLDDERLKLMKEIEEYRSEVNRVSNDIVRDQDPALKIQLIDEMRLVKEDIKNREEKLKEVMTEWQKLMVHVPNVPDMSVPDGASDEDNVEIRTWGEKPVFTFHCIDRQCNQPSCSTLATRLHQAFARRPPPATQKRDALFLAGRYGLGTLPPSHAGRGGQVFRQPR